MSKEFINKIEINRYKCFDNFFVKNIKRVNLISGKNNTGKTAFMEACFIGICSEDIIYMFSAFAKIKSSREIMDLLLPSKKDDMYDVKKMIEHYDGIDVVLNIHKVKFNISRENAVKIYKFSFLDKELEINSNDISFEENNSVSNAEFIDTHGFSSDRLIKLYSSIQEADKEQFLNDILNQIDNRIEAFKIIDEKPKCKFSGEYIALSEFGDGIRSYISIICTLFTCRDGYVFIDEIENGIHYSLFDKLWEIILKISKEQSVQVFATTHSKECIESYNRVAQKLKDEDISFINLSTNKKDKIVAITFDSGMFASEIKQNHEVREW